MLCTCINDHTAGMCLVCDESENRSIIHRKWLTICVTLEIHDRQAQQYDTKYRFICLWNRFIVLKQMLVLKTHHIHMV